MCLSLDTLDTQIGFQSVFCITGSMPNSNSKFRVMEVLESRISTRKFGDWNVLSVSPAFVNDSHGAVKLRMPYHSNPDLISRLETQI